MQNLFCPFITTAQISRGSSYSKEWCTEEDQSQLPTMAGVTLNFLGKSALTSLNTWVECSVSMWHFLKRKWPLGQGLNWPGRKCVGTAGPYTPLPQNCLCPWGPCKAAEVTWGSRSEAKARFERPSLIILHNLDGGTIPCQMESLQLHFGESKQIAKFGSTKYVNGCRGADDSLFLGWVPLTLSLFLAFEIVFSLQKVCLQNTFSII